MKKRIFSILLCTVMILAIIPSMAFAEGAAPTRTERLQLENQMTAVDNLDSEGWKWEPITDGENLMGGTLTLKDCYIKSDFCLNIKGKVTIVLEGNNIIESTLGSSNPVVSDGNAGNNLNLTIREGEGGGNLSILRADTTTTTDVATPYGIAGDSLTIQSGNIYCNMNLCTVTNDINISGGSVEVDATNLTDIYGIYTWNGDINISDGKVDVKTGAYGISTTNGNVTISGGTIGIDVEKVGIYAYGYTGVPANPLVNITGGDITIKSGLDGINAKNLTINSSGTLDVQATRSALRCNYANAVLQILAAKNLTLTGGTNAYFPEQTADGKTVIIADADYIDVNAAIAKVPTDLAPYTDDSVATLETVIDSVERDKNITEQKIVDGYALDIEKAISDLEYKPADYSKVDEALAKIPADLSGYTDASVKALNDAKAAVVRNKNLTEQVTVDAYATAILKAIDGLEKKTIIVDKVGTTPQTGDNNNILLCLVMLIISAGGIVTVRITKKSRKNIQNNK